MGASGKFRDRELLNGEFRVRQLGTGTSGLNSGGREFLVRGNLNCESPEAGKALRASGQGCILCDSAMNTVLDLLLEGESLTTAQMAQLLALPEAEVEAELTRLKEQGILLGWRPILSPEALGDDQVRALIEVKVTPERGGGFDRMAERIARFDEVETCYLMSGAYDLMVVVRGKSLHSVAMFVSGRLASIDGVLSTATHFMLRAYKEQGYLFAHERLDPDKPAVSP